MPFTKNGITEGAIGVPSRKCNDYNELPAPVVGFADTRVGLPDKSRPNCLTDFAKWT